VKINNNKNNKMPTDLRNVHTCTCLYMYMYIRVLVTKSCKQYKYYKLIMNYNNNIF